MSYRLPLRVIALILIAFAVGSFVFKNRSTFQCVRCLSTQHLFQWHCGGWMGVSFPLSSQRAVVQESHIYKDLVSKPHAHEWVFRQGSPYYWFGTTWGGCALGLGADRNPTADLYEALPDFRDFVRQKIREGRLTPAYAVDLFLAHSVTDSEEGLSSSDMELAKAARVLEEAYHSQP